MGSLWRLHGVGEVVGELLAPIAGPGLAQLLLHLPGGVVALLGGDLLAGDAALTVLGLVLASVKVNREDAGPVLDNLLLLPAVLVLDVHTLEVILCSHGQVVHGFAHPVVHFGAALHGVLLFHHLVLDGLSQLAHQFCHVEALPFLKIVDDDSAVFLEDVLAELLLLGVASLLHVGHAFIGVHNFLHRVAVVLVAGLIDLVGGVVGIVDRLVLVVPSSDQGLNMDGIAGLKGAAQYTGDQQHQQLFSKRTVGRLY